MNKLIHCKVTARWYSLHHAKMPTCLCSHHSNMKSVLLVTAGPWLSRYIMASPPWVLLVCHANWKWDKCILFWLSAPLLKSVLPVGQMARQTCHLVTGWDSLLTLVKDSFRHVASGSKLWLIAYINVDLFMQSTNHATIVHYTWHLNLYLTLSVIIVMPNQPDYKTWGEGAAVGMELWLWIKCL